MAVNLRRARDYVYSNGTLWERALFAYHFEDSSLQRLQSTLRCYKNPDGGFGHALEHDVRCPDSHPLALEFLLTVLDYGAVPVSDLLDGTPEWIAQQLAEDGALINPPAVLDYPHAPWWNSGGQTQPTSIAGHLTALGMCPPLLAASTQEWVRLNLTLDVIHSNTWLFMAYHAYDYFMHVDDFPNVEVYRVATVDNILECAGKAPDNQLYEVFKFAQTPESRVARALPPALRQRALDYLLASQQEDGCWLDEHNLPQWYPHTTIKVLLALRRFGLLEAVSG